MSEDTQVHRNEVIHGPAKYVVAGDVRVCYSRLAGETPLIRPFAPEPWDEESANWPEPPADAARLTNEEFLGCDFRNVQFWVPEYRPRRWWERLLRRKVQRPRTWLTVVGCWLDPAPSSTPRGE